MRAGLTATPTLFSGMSIWSGIAADGVAIALALAAVRVFRDRVHDPAGSQDEPEDSGSTVPRAVRGRQFQHDLDAPRRMGPGHRRRLGFRMGVVGPLASRAGAEVGSQENGSDDQTDSNDDHGSPASAGGARPLVAGT